MLPLGRGQRELIIGDRETGKTAIAIDTIINQRDTGVICVYCAVGQKTSSVSQVIDAVKRYGAPERCIFVFAPSDDPPGIQWLAPYAACTMAEYFSERGGDALLIIDDLSKHAVIYRQLSLLLRNPPGREAYPGDIFYIHSRLLERAAKLNHERGGGSLTALPIAATEEGNLSAYIPTNLISITDGQIVLEPRLFHEGQKPAVNVGKSVSRVGGKTQSHAMRKLAENLRLEYAQFLELEIFTRFGGMVDERTRADHRAWATNSRGPHAAAIRAAVSRASSGVAGGNRRTAARPASARQSASAPGETRPLAERACGGTDAANQHQPESWSRTRARRSSRPSENWWHALNPRRRASPK